MKQLYLTIIYGMIMITACNTNKEEVKILKQSDFPAPPVAEVVPDTFENFGQKRIDNYYWLKDKNNPKVIEYLNAENEYTESVMASTKELQQTIYDEILGRIKEDDESYPSYINGYWYYSRTEKGKQYRTYLRRKGSLDAEEEVIFDVNKMAEGKSAFIFAGYSVSPDNNKVAYLFNETGSYAEYVMKIKDLNTDEEIGFTVIGATSVTWANDNNTLFYGVIDQTLRPYQIHRRGLNEHQSSLIYEEKDAKFRTYVSGTKTKEYIFIGSASSTTSEERYISADRPLDEFKVFMPRVKDVEYSVFPHKEKFFVSYKDRENLNSMIYEVPLTGYEDKSTWKVFLPHDDDARLEGIDIVKDYISVELRREGLTEIIVMSLNGGDTKNCFPEPVYSASMGGNPSMKQQQLDILILR